MQVFEITENTFHFKRLQKQQLCSICLLFFSQSVSRSISGQSDIIKYIGMASSSSAQTLSFCIVDYSYYYGCSSLCFDTIVKELAVYDPTTDWYRSWIFRPPYPQKNVGHIKQAANDYLYENVVKIKWDVGDVPYNLLPTTLRSAVSNTDFVVVGDADKAEFVSSLLHDRKISILDVDSDTLAAVAAAEGAAVKTGRVMCTAHKYSSSLAAAVTKCCMHVCFKPFDFSEKALSCPLNRCLMTNHYIKRELGKHKIPTLKQTWYTENYRYLPFP
jgi:hypothetical protein